MSNATAAELAVAAVVAARFLLPLAIPKYPLPGVFASLMVDAADQTVFQSVLGADLSRYQPYDKALDIYLLSILMLATLRNWQSRPAVVVARVLFYVRVLGVLAFELTGWRPLLVIFTNTFEYFFIFYEIVRAWWSPARLRLRTLLLAAATLWMIVKVPQEYLLHVARLGLTDLIREQVIRANP